MADNTNGPEGTDTTPGCSDDIAASEAFVAIGKALKGISPEAKKRALTATLEIEGIGIEVMRRLGLVPPKRRKP